MELSWDESSEPTATFLRYQIYRRVVGESTWTKIARVNDRAETGYQDFTAGSGIHYEYAVTVVAAADSGEEVESAFPTAVTGLLTVRSFFIHSVDSPGVYVEIEGEAADLSPMQERALLQVWGRAQPTAHFGTARSDVYSIRATAGWLDDSERWTALMALLEAQRTSYLCLRSFRDVRLFGTIAPPTRADTQSLFGVSIEFAENYYLEAVP